MKTREKCKCGMQIIIKDTLLWNGKCPYCKRTIRKYEIINWRLATKRNLESYLMEARQ